MPTEADKAFVEKLRSLSFPRKMGQSERRSVINEETGRVGGHQVEHWDGRQDAHVRPDSVKLKTIREE